jgi:hypothetical protein
VNRNDVDWEGPITAMITPFHRDGDLDERGLRRTSTSSSPTACAASCRTDAPGEFWAQTMPSAGASPKSCSTRRQAACR